MRIGFKARPLAVVVGAALAVVVGCGGGGAERRNQDAAPPIDAPRDVPVNGDGSGSTDRPDTGMPLKPNGESCSQGQECVSTFCADGVCCNSDCSAACYTCAAPGVMGTCVPSDVGTNPRSLCTDNGAGSCGHNGQCDGTGACQNYSAGTMCQAAGCTGFTLTSAGRCDGQGSACPTAGSQSCAPYMCGANGQCATTCMKDTDCVAPATCINGSCGKKPPGAPCGADGECNSSICATGVCCATTCAGTCKSCALSGSAGTCTNVPAGQDPLMQCADAGAMTCGNDGFCDGMGACRLYDTSTVCGTNSCTSGTATIAGKCSGMGLCLAGTLQNCSPYVCGASACLTKCATNADCASGNVCNGTICGKKVTGTMCQTAAECASGYCEQGYCCNTGCAATCMSCALTGTQGTCTAIAAGQAPAAASQCPMATMSTCGNDGKCNGAGASEQWSAGTQCMPPSCTGSTLTSAGTCDGSGLCKAGTNSMCDPFKCGTTSACGVVCATNADCVSPNTCMSGSCGKKPPGSTCSAGAECVSTFCVQGVCCNSACTGTCKSCTVTGSVGTCANVPAGQTPTPSTQCTDGGSASCGNDGTCDGNGACRNYVSSTVCAAASCAGSTYTPPRTCNGTGTCGAASSSSCGAYNCDTTNNICKTTCTADTDCVSPNVCNGGTCSKKILGAPCATATECNSGFCAQGVCCATACTGTCQSCALSASLGTCANVPAGQAPNPTGQCTDGGATTCGQNGMCDGTGKCQLYANGTVCVAGSCTGSTLTPARTCDGAGSCKTVTTSLCDPYACDTTNKVCKTTCASTTDCASPNTCTLPAGTCGQKPLGATCASGSECNSGLCQQSTCCSTTCSGTCVSCANSAGSCSAVAAGTDPLNQCTMAAASTCGLDGFCDGSGACRKYASGTSCAAATCTGNTLTPAASCNGSGTCVTPATVNCSPYLCGTGACKTTCASNSDCLAPNFVCVGTSCSSATMLTVKLKVDITTPNLWITTAYQITNNGTTAVPMSDLTLKYWYTYDTTPVVAQASGCNYAQTPPAACANITFATWTAVSPARTNADYYFQIGFVAAAGSIAPGATAEFQVQWHKNDWSNFTLTNDYSFNNSAAFATTTKVTVYRLGTLVYGTEP